MNHHSFISATQTESNNGIKQPCCTAIPPIHNFLSVESEGLSLSTGECSSPHPSPFIQKESHSYPHKIRAPTSQSHKCCFPPGPNSPWTRGSHLQHSKGSFSRSSVFCTSLYLSSSSSSETHRQLGNLPFLPRPPSYNHSVSSVDSTKSPLSFSEGIGNPYEEEHSESLVKDLFNLPGDISDGSFHGVTCTDDSLALNDHLELHFLSDELDIAITDNGENPRVDVSTL